MIWVLFDSFSSPNLWSSLLLFPVYPTSGDLQDQPEVSLLVFLFFLELGVVEDCALVGRHLLIAPRIEADMPSPNGVFLSEVARIEDFRFGFTVQAMHQIPNPICFDALVSSYLVAISA
jgi:hypothetical protein